MIVHRFADGDFCGPNRRGIVAALREFGQPMAELLNAAVFLVRTPREDPGLDGRFSKSEVCALSPEQLEGAARRAGLDGAEFLFPPIMWTLDVPANLVRVGEDQVMLEWGAGQ